jgi:hypothetical protein
MSILLPLIAGVMCCHVTAQDSPPLNRRDGLPTGGASPEAAACDMVRALVHRSFQNFSKARPQGGGGGDTPNDIVNHYVSFVRDTTFRSDGKVVTAHELLQRVRLIPKKVASAVAIESDLHRPYQSKAFFGAHTQHSYVDVTVSGRDGTDFTTRMIVVCTRKHGLWKAYPITPGIEPLYQKLDRLVTVNDLHTESRNSPVAAKIISFKTQPKKVGPGSTVPGRELILTIQNNSDLPVRSVFADVTYRRSDGAKITLHNSRVYWAYDNEPGISPGKIESSLDGRGCLYSDFMDPRGFKIEITEVSDTWMLQSTLPNPSLSPGGFTPKPKTDE